MYITNSVAIQLSHTTESYIHVQLHYFADIITITQYTCTSLTQSQYNSVTLQKVTYGSSTLLTLLQLTQYTTLQYTKLHTVTAPCLHFHN